MLERLRQLACKIGVQGTYSSSVESATYARMPILANTLKIEPMQKQNERAHSRATLRNLRSVPGAKIFSIKFSTELQGSGTRGAAPSVGAALRACGMTETITGSGAAIGTLYYDPHNAAGDTFVLGTDLQATGTYGGTYSGVYKVTATEVNGAPSVDIEFISRDGNGRLRDYTKNSIANLTSSVFGDGRGLTLAISAGVFGAAGNVVWIPVTAAGSDQVYYAPRNGTSTAFECVNFAAYIDGQKWTFHSGTGTVSGGWAGTGEIGKLNFDFLAILNAKADGALLDSISYEEVAPPAFKGLTFTLGGSSIPCFNSFTFDLGNVMAGRECATSADGYDRATIRSGKITGAIDPIRVLLASYDPHGLLFSGASGVLSCVVGSDSGNIITIQSQHVSVESVGDADRGGETVTPMGLLFSEGEFEAANADYGPGQFGIIFT